MGWGGDQQIHAQQGSQEKVVPYYICWISRKPLDHLDMYQQFTVSKHGKDSEETSYWRTEYFPHVHQNA